MKRSVKEKCRKYDTHMVEQFIYRDLMIVPYTGTDCITPKARINKSAMQNMIEFDERTKITQQVLITLSYVELSDIDVFCIPITSPFYVIVRVCQSQRSS